LKNTETESKLIASTINVEFNIFSDIKRDVGGEREAWFSEETWKGVCGRDGENNTGCV